MLTGLLECTIYLWTFHNRAESELFLVRPGDGENFVYSPVGVNVTLHCAVNDTKLSWVVDGLNFNVQEEKELLHLRGIFQTPSTPMEGITKSTVTVFSDESRNIKVCCRFVTTKLNEACTTVSIYGKEYHV